MPEPRIELLIVDPQVDFMDLPASGIVARKKMLGGSLPIGA